MLIKDVKAVFHNSGYSAVKLQLSFYIILEDPGVEEKNIYEKYSSSSSSSSSSDSLEYLSTITNKRQCYALDVYNVNFDKNSLITVSYNSIGKIKDFIIYMLKDLQIKNSDNGESCDRVIAVYKLQVFLYNISKNTGGKIGEKCLISSFIHNQYTYSISASTLYWFTCVSYLYKKERIMRIVKLELFMQNNFSLIIMD
jgi:hypothetical protein